MIAEEDAIAYADAVERGDWDTAHRISGRQNLDYGMYGRTKKKKKKKLQVWSKKKPKKEKIKITLFTNKKKVRAEERRMKRKGRK